MCRVKSSAKLFRVRVGFELGLGLSWGWFEVGAELGLELGWSQG